MTLPNRVKVRPSQNFLTNLEEAEAFFAEQDRATVAVRMEALRASLREMVAVLRWSPAGGRLPRFETARSAQAQLRLSRIKKLAVESGVPTLREYVVDQFVVLYAHSDSQVVLLSLKHQRQLSYSTH